MNGARYFLTTGPGTVDADYRAWLARHPGAMWTGRLVVATVAVLVLSFLAVFVVPPLVSLWLCALVGLWGYMTQRDRQRRARDRERRELRAALQKR